MTVEPALRPPPGNPRFPLVDSLRAIAAISIFITHAYSKNGRSFHSWLGVYTDRLDIGVTIFFVISSFLLYRPFVAARLGRGQAQPTGDYLWRRLLRIVPAYWFALTVAWILFGLPQMSTSHWWVYYAFGQVYHQAWVLGGIVPTWSLAVEASFYLALPLLALLLARVTRSSSRGEMLGAELLILALIFVTANVVRDLSPSSAVANSLPGFADWFVVGMVLALASAYLDGRDKMPLPVRLIERRPGLCWIAAIGAFVAVAQIGPRHISLFAPVTTEQAVSRHLLYGLIAALIVMPAIFGWKGGGVPRAILRNRGLAWLGLISYGLFLWQVPILDYAWGGAGHPLDGSHTGHIMILGALATLAAATVSYYGVERPLLRYKNALPESLTRAAATRPAGSSAARG